MSIDWPFWGNFYKAECRWRVGFDDADCHLLPFLYKVPKTPILQTFTLKMAEIFSETLHKHQHPTRPSPKAKLTRYWISSPPEPLFFLSKEPLYHIFTKLRLPATSPFSAILNDMEFVWFHNLSFINSLNRTMKENYTKAGTPINNIIVILLLI